MQRKLMKSVVSALAAAGLGLGAASVNAESLSYAKGEMRDFVVECEPRWWHDFCWGTVSYSRV